jgi:acyl-CoA thioester hydrolase
MKPAAYRLITTNYPDYTQVSIRYADLDPASHLNNVALGQFYEEGRTHFIRHTLGKDDLMRAYRMLAAEVSVQYLKEGRHPGALDVATGVARIGRSSFVLGQALFQDGMCIGTADVTMVLAKAEGAAEMSDAIRRALEARSIRPADAAAGA